LPPAERELEGKVVVITGAAKGLGRAYALDVVAEGGKVVVNDVDEDALHEIVEEISGSGGEVAPHLGDVSARGAAEELIGLATREFGRLDGLVNNAGIRPEGAAWEEDPDLARRAVEINLIGSLTCGIAACGVMREQGSGSVINVASRAQSGIPSSPAYSATKGALASLTYSWAIDMLPHGARVNAIAPQAGATGTRRAGASAEGEPRAEEMAPLVTYLLCDRSVQVTGQVIRLGRSRPTSLDLALMSHPATSRSYVSDSGWTVESLAELFDGGLGAELEPVGAEPIPVAYRIVGGVPVLIDSSIGL
jgi:NAD(P)-dependent dehydrogenase (short-subunit alcohol dehydrogenase family)